ncbi:MAG: TetR/AcrR family transcriptional regulator, partial [Thermodesulfobacteriota bacterium]|nr:TetR/AcrR family transcriptional regulator [Thermodesulfobacteriota bacterium]
MRKRKAEIIEKATDLFYKHGFVKASIRDIVKAVGITNSTVYIYFENKDEILYTIIVDIGEILLKEIRSAIEAHDDPVECLREMIFRQICIIKSKRKQIKIYMEEQYQLPPVLQKKVYKQHRLIYDLYFDTISKIKEKGITRPINETVMTFSVFAMMNWSTRWYDSQGSLPIEEIAEQTISLFFGGIF